MGYFQKGCCMRREPGKGSMRYYSTQYWNRGKRNRNEDSLCIEQVQTRRGRVLLAMVCDGIGGLAGGEIASGYVAEEVLKWFYEDGMKAMRFGNMECVAQGLKKRLEQICDSLFLYGKERGIRLGTTASILFLWEHRFFLFHIGDSRIYRIRFGCRQLTKDQINAEGALLQAVGASGQCIPQIQFGRIVAGDRFLICSDGFYRKQKGHNLCRMFGRKASDFLGTKKEKNWEKILKESAEALLRKGETDNISAVFICCLKGGRTHGSRL